MGVGVISAPFLPPPRSFHSFSCALGMCMWRGVPPHLPGTSTNLDQSLDSASSSSHPGLPQPLLTGEGVGRVNFPPSELLLAPASLCPPTFSFPSLTGGVGGWEPGGGHLSPLPCSPLLFITLTSKSVGGLQLEPLTPQG